MVLRARQYHLLLTPTRHAAKDATMVENGCLLSRNNESTMVPGNKGEGWVSGVVETTLSSLYSYDALCQKSCISLVDSLSFSFSLSSRPLNKLISTVAKL